MGVGLIFTSWAILRAYCHYSACSFCTQHGRWSINIVESEVEPLSDVQISDSDFDDCDDCDGEDEGFPDDEDVAAADTPQKSATSTTTVQSIQQSTAVQTLLHGNWRKTFQKGTTCFQR